MNEQDYCVFVVDDDSSVRNSLKRLLTTFGYRVKTFVSAQEFLDFYDGHEEPACLILDIMMPGLNGLDLLNELRSRRRSIPIIFITALDDVPTTVNAMKGGAVDFLTKPFEEADLLEAVELALQKDLRQQLLSTERDNITQRIDSLTSREREILSHVISGRLNKQIAYDLKISERTVKAHRHSIMEKMEAESLAELVRLSEKAGLQPAPDTDI